MATSIRLAPDIERRLHFLAEPTGRTKAYYLRQLIENGLADLEDDYLALATLARVRKGLEWVHAVADVRDLGGESTT